MPEILSITREAGIAGQYGYAVRVQYDSEPVETVRFVGSAYGGPVVMVSPNGTQVFVDRAVTERCGATLTPEWVRRFYGQAV